MYFIRTDRQLILKKGDIKVSQNPTIHVDSKVFIRELYTSLHIGLVIGNIDVTHDVDV